MLTALLEGQRHPQSCVDLPPLDKEAFLFHHEGNKDFY